ncbi:MAG: rod shape-determining protein MreD [Negativicutes bacterium]|nr:rod shape-determining protein MreD [Negativicutes bacterium]
MSMVIWPLFLLLLLSLQTSWFSFFPGADSTPDFLLLFVVFQAMYGGSNKGAISGFFVGLVQDALAPTYFGFHIVTRVLIGYFTGETKERVFKDNFQGYAVFVIVASILVKTAHALLLLMVLKSASGWFIDHLLGAMSYIFINLIVSWPTWLALQKISAWLEKRNSY